MPSLKDAEQKRRKQVSIDQKAIRRSDIESQRAKKRLAKSLEKEASPLIQQVKSLSAWPQWLLETQQIWQKDENTIIVRFDIKQDRFVFALQRNQEILDLYGKPTIISRGYGDHDTELFLLCSGSISELRSYFIQHWPENVFAYQGGRPSSNSDTKTLLLDMYGRDPFQRGILRNPCGLWAIGLISFVLCLVLYIWIL